MSAEAEPRNRAVGRSERDVDVLLVESMSPEIEAGRYLPLLHPDEVERAERYRRREDRARFILGRGLLREILGRRIDIAPQLLRFEFGPYGKPFLAGRAPHFSLSHAGRWIAIAIADRDVGLDIEELSDIDPLPLLAFSPAERERTRFSADPTREFISIWVAKEAVLKMAGCGLRGPTIDFSVPILSARRPRLISASPSSRLGGIGVIGLPVAHGLHGAVAASGCDWQVAVRRYHPTRDERASGAHDGVIGRRPRLVRRCR